MKNRVVRIFIGLSAVVFLFTFISKNSEAKTCNQKKAIVENSDTLDFPGVVVHVPHDWKFSAWGSSNETTIYRGAAYSDWICTYDSTKSGWSWYSELPLCHDAKMNFEMSTVQTDGYLNAKNKLVKMKSYDDLKGPYFEKSWSDKSGNPAFSFAKTSVDTILANGQHAYFTHASEIEHMPNLADGSIRIEIWEQYQLLYWSASLKKAVEFKMIFKIFRLDGYSATIERKNENILLDGVRAKDSELTDYAKKFISSLDMK